MKIQNFIKLNERLNKSIIENNDEMPSNIKIKDDILKEYFKTIKGEK